MAVRDKLAKTNRIIDAVLEAYKKPVLMWSAGKDSMVLAFILKGRHLLPRMPVVSHCEPYFANKYLFMQKIRAQWGLKVYDWPPVAITLQKPGEAVEIVNHYPVCDGRTVAIPKNLYEPVGLGTKSKKVEPFLCGLVDFLRRPLGGVVQYPWDVVIHGHKSSDVDPGMGPVPLKADVVPNIMGPAGAFPLRDWTDADIWEYTKSFKVPQQETRYDLESGEELEDKRHNPDQWACCTRCFDPDGPGSMMCPKLGVEVSNVSKQVEWREPERPDYLEK